MDTHLVRASAGSELYQRHQRMTRCLPSFLVIGTQKGGTSSFHFLLKSGWHDAVRVNSGEKEIHYFSWDDIFRKGPLVYQRARSPPISAQHLTRLPTSLIFTRWVAMRRWAGPN